MSAEVKRYEVSADEDGMRLDRWFKTHYAGLGFGMTAMNFWGHVMPMMVLAGLGMALVVAAAVVGSRTPVRPAAGEFASRRRHPIFRLAAEMS